MKLGMNNLSKTIVTSTQYGSNKDHIRIQNIIAIQTLNGLNPLVSKDQIFQELSLWSSSSWTIWLKSNNFSDLTFLIDCQCIKSLQ